MKKLDKGELNSIQFQILVNFSDFCEKNTLRYSLAGGTLLGAVRHKGFIPWDDDIDVMMPRPDYEYFLANYEKNNDEYELFCSSKKGTQYLPKCFSKISKIGTKLIQPHSPLKVNMGINIDVFPIDGLSSDLHEAEKRNENIKRYHFIHTIKFRLSHKMKGWRRYRLLLVQNLLKCVASSFLVKKMEKNTCRYEDASFVTSIGSIYYSKEFTEKTLYEEYDKLSFEDMSFSVIQNYHFYLSMLYGDYMQLPPEDKRFSHGYEAYLL